MDFFAFDDFIVCLLGRFSVISQSVSIFVSSSSN